MVLEGMALPRSVLIIWNDNSENENGFVVERTISASCNDDWQVIGYTGVNQTSFVDSYIPGACYRVAAYNENGVSTYSNAALVQG